MKKLKTLSIVALLLATTVLLVSIASVKAEETLIWAGDVYSSGETVTSPVLETGKQYRIMATQIFWYDYANGLEADAQYYSTIPANWNWLNNFPAPNGHSFLQINEMDQNWGPFSNGDTGHTYSITYMGEGEAIRFRIVDWIDGDCSNNHCHLPVFIYLVNEEYYGCTPGFWKNHKDVWPSPYTTTTLLRSVFGDNAPSVALLQALKSKGGPGISGAKDILARSATAALLNSAVFGDNYPVPNGQLINLVTYQFNYGTRDSILSLATELDQYNNLGCPSSWP